jgi:hypothetical protein
MTPMTRPIRHLLTHNNGVVDAKHVARYPTSGLVVGQRASVSVDDALDAICLARILVAAV